MSSSIPINSLFSSRSLVRLVFEIRERRDLVVFEVMLKGVAFEARG